MSLSNKSKSLDFGDFGPIGNYREPLKALRVVSRMTAGFFSLPPKNYTRVVFKVFRTSKPWQKMKRFENSQKLQQIIYWLAIGSCLLDPQHPKHPSLGPTSIPIPTLHQRGPIPPCARSCTIELFFQDWLFFIIHG